MSISIIKSSNCNPLLISDQAVINKGNGKIMKNAIGNGKSNLTLPYFCPNYEVSYKISK